MRTASSSPSAAHILEGTIFPLALSRESGKMWEDMAQRVLSHFLYVLQSRRTGCGDAFEKFHKVLWRAHLEDTPVRQVVRKHGEIVEPNVVETGGTTEDHMIMIPELFLDLFLASTSRHGHEHVNSMCHRYTMFIASGLTLLVLVRSHICRGNAVASGRHLNEL